MKFFTTMQITQQHFTGEKTILTLIINSELEVDLISTKCSSYITA